MSIRDEINRKILAYEDAIGLLAPDETVARSLLNYARAEMLEVLAKADNSPIRKKAA